MSDLYEIDQGKIPLRKVDCTKPHWRCVCGVVAMPLTDDTSCHCSDYYEQDWTYIEPTTEQIAACFDAPSEAKIADY